MKRYWIATEILLLSMILKQRDKNSKENRKNEKKKQMELKKRIPQAYLIMLYVWKPFCLFLQQFSSVPRRHCPLGFSCVEICDP